MSDRSAVINMPLPMLALVMALGTAADAVELKVEIRSAGNILSGTLSIPETSDPVPAVVLISGSGPSDRNEALAGITIKPFELLAEELSARGIAVLRYDDRGVGQSTGDYASATSLDFAHDAAAAVTLLATRPEINPDAIGVIGHSEGGMIAPMVALESADLDFIVALAAPAVRGYDIIAEQLRRTAAELPEPGREAAYRAWTRLLDQVAIADWGAAEADLRLQYNAMSPGEKVKAGGAEDFVGRAMTYNRGWFHFFVTHDPAEDWRQVGVPVLAIYGGLDVAVPADVNAPALRAALANNPDVTVLELPTANHLFQDAVTGFASEYEGLPEEFVGGLVATIAEWIHATAASTNVR